MHVKEVVMTDGKRNPDAVLNAGSFDKKNPERTKNHLKRGKARHVWQKKQDTILN